MDLNQILQMGAKAFIESNGSGEAGSNLDIGSVMSAFSSLSDGNEFNIGSIIGLLQQGDIGDMLQSWLGDGDNQAISANQITDIFGSDKISAMASQLGVTEAEALGGLQDALPKMVDSSSSGGSLLDSLGGAQGAFNLAKSLF